MKNKDNLKSSAKSLGSDTANNFSLITENILINKLNLESCQ